MNGADAGMLGAKLGAGREADVHQWGGDAVVKLYRPGFGGHRAEAVALAALEGHHVAPGLLGVVECDGRTGLVLQRLQGLDMLTLLQRHPWQMFRLARAMATAQLAVHSVAAPEDLPRLREVLAARIEEAELPSPLRAFVLRVLGGLPDGDRLCHGDLHPGNVLVAAGQVGVIDWPGAARGVPEADLARTMLLLRQAHPLPGTPLGFRALMAVGRALFAGAFARTYRQHAPGPLHNVDSWLLVQTAARLSEGINTETPQLMAYIERAHRFA